MPRVHLDYYVTLGVSPETSDEEIKRAYRKLALQYHPDRNQGNKDAEIKIREINAAYEILGDPETRKSYERLRFGGFGKSAETYGTSVDEAPDPTVVLQEMEKRLWDEARKELFSVLIKQVDRIKQELAVIREQTIAKQGYDTFHEDVVVERGRHVLREFIDPEIEQRRQRLLDVALHMLLSQQVVQADNEQEADALKKQLEMVYDRGCIEGYRQACELFYVRR